MHLRSLLYTLTLLTATLVGAQDDIEPTCPGPCAFGSFDEDRLISDCTAQCNTSFGDPDAAQVCVEGCSNWRDSISCTATPAVTRRSSNGIERRRRALNASGRSLATSHTDDEEGNDKSADMHLSNSLGQPLERRDSWGQCINNCTSKFRIPSICPGNIAALVAQAGM